MTTISTKKPALELPDMLNCGSCGALFPHGAWAEHLLTCPVAPAQDRSAEILEGLSRRMAALGEVAARQSGSNS